MLSDSGPTFDILVKVFQFGVFCSKNVSVTALYGLKPRYYYQIFLLAVSESPVGDSGGDKSSTSKDLSVAKVSALLSESLMIRSCL